MLLQPHRCLQSIHGEKSHPRDWSHLPSVSRSLRYRLTRQPLPALQCLSETPVAFLCVSNKVKLILNCWCFWRESGPWEHAFAPCRLWQCHLLAKQTPFLSCLYQLSLRSSLVRFASDHCPLHGHPSQNQGHMLEGWVAGRQNIALWLSKDISSYPKCCSLHPLEIFL